MSITKVSKFVLEDNSVSLGKLDTASGFEGQILAIGTGGILQFEDKLVTEDVEDIVAGLILRGNHTNISVSYVDGSNQLNLNASGAVTSVNTQTGTVVLDTDDITEGSTNLYYTDTRVQSVIDINSAGFLTAVSFSDLTTTPTTLSGYGITDAYTQTQVNQAISIAQTNANSYTDTAVSNLIDSAPGALDTLNELAAAIGDDANFASTITNGLALKLDIADFDSTFDTRLALKTTDDLAEGSTNLYYTDDRVDNRVTELLIAGNNVSLSTSATTGEVTIDSDIDSTTDVPEGTNLYYTDARVQSVIDTNTAGFITDYTVTQADVTQHQAALSITQSQISDLDHYNSTDFSTDFAAKSTTDLSEGTNLYYTDARVDERIALQTGANVDLSSKDTDDLSEGSTNLYYTDARAQAAITGGTGVGVTNGVVSIGQPVATTDNVQFADMTITGDLIVSGNTTTVNTETVNLADNILLLNSNETGSPTQAGGIEIERGTSVNVSFLWDEGNDRWTIGAENLFTSGTFIGNLQGNVNGNVTGQVTDISNHTTDDVAEGISNLYYTDTRFDNRFNSKDTDDITEGAANLYWTVARTRGAIGVTGDLTYNSGTGVLHFALNEQTTTQLPEGTNLYYTDARADARVDILRTDLATSGDANVHFDNISNVPAVTKDVITGDGTNATFNLSVTPGNADAVIVTMNGVTQMPGSDYTVSGSTITFTTTPPTGQVVLVRHVGYQIVGSVADNDLSLTGGTMSGSILVNADNQYDLGSSTNQWRTIYGHEVEATFADLAERYATDAPYAVGTVVVFGGEAEITLTSEEMDVSVAGIISGAPALKMNAAAGNNETHPYVALRGRVPCQVIGPVRKGDLIVTSSTPGFGKSVGKRDLGHAVFAKAIETNLDEGRKLVEVVVI